MTCTADCLLGQSSNRKKEEEVMRVSTKKAVLFSILSLLLNTAISNVSQAGEKTLPEHEAIATAAAKKVEVTEASFKCLHEMTKVGDLYVDNLLGDLDGTLAIAKSPDGGIYPPGSVVQLLPGEAMVKLEKGAHPSTNDWEFFDLEVSPEGSKIKQGGFEEVKNMFGTCISCHQQPSAPQADMICAAGHACPPVVFPCGINTEVLIAALQKTDKRCSGPEVPTPEELAELKKLQDCLAAAAAGGGQ
jgi:hypothetical protein